MATKSGKITNRAATKVFRATAVKRGIATSQTSLSITSGQHRASTKGAAAKKQR